VFDDPGRKLSEAMKGVAISRNQFALAGLNVGKRPEAVDLQFVDE
jgi:hypothetical protein